jgi:hypothetical protein
MTGDLPQAGVRSKIRMENGDCSSISLQAVNEPSRDYGAGMLAWSMFPLSSKIALRIKGHCSRWEHKAA